MFEYVPTAPLILQTATRLTGQAQPVTAARHAEREVGDPVAEGVGLGVDAVGTPDPQRRPVLQAEVAQHADQRVGPLEQQVGRLDELQRQRGVEQVGRRHPEVHVGGGLARGGLIGPGGQERDHVVLGDRLDLGDGFGRGRRRGAHRFDRRLPGTTPAAAWASSTSTSTWHHSSYLWASDQTRPMAGSV